MIPDCAVAAMSVHIYLSAVFTWSGFECNDFTERLYGNKKKSQSNIIYILVL